jgi:hypothetical protein
MNMNLQGGATQRAQRPNAGIDVSKRHLDACWGGADLRSGNDTSGWAELIAKLQADDVDLVVVQTTGGYERGVVTALQAAGITVARVNPRQARDFAKSLASQRSRRFAPTATAGAHSGHRPPRRAIAFEIHFLPFTCPSSSMKVGRSVEYSTLRPNSIATCGA